MEGPNILRENWKEFHKRVKPILKMMKEEIKKDMEQGVLLQGLKELVTSITESNKSISPQRNVNIPLQMIPIPLP